MLFRNTLHKPYRLEITDGTTTIDLTKPPFYISEWRPNVPFYKGDGTFQDSPLSDGRQLVDKQFTNVIDTISFKVSTNTLDNAVRKIQDLRRLLERASDYWVQDWNTTPIYIAAQSREETNIRYAPIITGRIPEDEFPYGQIVQIFREKRSVWDDMTMILEHGLWLDNVPGVGTAISVAGNQIISFSETSTINANAQDAEARPGSTTLLLNGTSIGMGDDLGLIRNGAYMFPSVAIPKGATITSAKITFTEVISSALGNLYLKIEGEDIDSASVFSTWANYAGRTRTSANVAWLKPTVSGGETETPDIKTIVQEIADRSGWASGGNMAFFIDNDNSDTDSYITIEAQDNPGTDPPILTVEYTFTVGQEATTDDQVYVGNKQNKAYLTDIYNYDDTGASFGSNLFDDVTAELFPNPAGVDDIVYFSSSVGVFSSLVFDLATGAAAGTSYTLVWEYWDGAAWSTLTVADNTSSLATTGVNSVHWTQPSDWAKTTINGLNQYWVRATLSALTGAFTNPVQQNREIYTVTWGYFTPSLSGGDIPASLVESVLQYISGNATTEIGDADNVYLAVRSDVRGSDFSAYMNSQGQLPDNVSVTLNGALAAILTSVTDTSAASGEAIAFAPSFVGPFPESRDLFEYTLANQSQWKGRYRVFLRYYQTSVSDTVQHTVNLRLITGSAFSGTSYDILTTTAVDLAISTSVKIADLGNIVIYDLVNSIVLTDSVDGNTVTNSMRFLDLILIPTDETTWNAVQYDGSSILDYDATDGQKNLLTEFTIKNQRSVLRDSSDVDLITWRLLTNSYSISFPANNDFKVWVLAIDSQNDEADVFLTHKTSLSANKRYLSMRGEQ